MLAREIEDCDYCPLIEEGLCTGGFTSDGRGMPMEPPCCSWDPDEDIDQWIINFYERRRRAEEWADKKYREAQAKKERAAKAAKTRSEVRQYTSKERDELKMVERRLRVLERQIDFARSMAEAFNFADNMMGGKPRYVIPEKESQQIQQLKRMVKEAEARLKAKREEFYRIRKQKGKG